MQEIKYLLYGQFRRPNGHVMNDCLGYIKENVEDAIDTCKRLNPHFHIEAHHYSLHTFPL